VGPAAGSVTTTVPPAVRGGVRDLAAAVLAGTIGTFSVSLVSALAVQVRESLHFGTSALAIAVALYFLGAAVGSVPLSRVSERVGGIRVMRVTVMASAVLLALQGFAMSWLMLALLLVLAGMSSSAMQPAINLFLARRMPQGRQGVAFGVKQAAIPLAALLAGLAVPGIALTVGWRPAFYAAAVIAAATAVLIPRPPTPLASRRRQRQAAGEAVPAVALTILTIGFGLGIAAATGLWSFLVTSAVAAGMGKGTAGLVAAVAGAAAMTMRVGVGAAADHRGRGHFLTVALLLIAGAAGYTMLAVAAWSRLTWLFAISAVVALGAGWGFNGLFNYAVVDANRHAPARATGLTAVGGRLGGVAGPLLVGLAAVHASYSAAWALDAMLALTAAATIAYGRLLLARYHRAA
jgi:MFS family permease